MSQHRTSHFFGGQTPHTPDSGQAKTLCRGFKGHPCDKMLEAKLGVLEPRCPECYKKHLELVKGVEPNTVKDAYPDGACPDCGEAIPDDAPEGWGCPNCGHACFSENGVDQKSSVVQGGRPG